MNEIYKTLAEGYEKLAAGYRALAKDQKDEKGSRCLIQRETREERNRLPLRMSGQYWLPRHRLESAEK